MRLRRIQRYCSQCGKRMGRQMGLIYRAGYDQRTGKRAWIWYWGCPDALFGYSRSYLDGRPYHDARRISTSRARAAKENR